MAADPENHLSNQHNNESANGFCTVNSYMISSKIAHFLNEVRSCINEFIMIFYVGIGFNKRDAGFINGIQLFGAIVASPFWAYIADKHGIHKFIVSFLCVMALMTMSTLPLLSVIYGDKQKNVCPYKVGNTTNIGISDKYSWGNHDILYYSMLFTGIIAATFDGSITGFVDSGVVRRVETSPQKTNYGHQKYFGSLGYCLGSIMFGFSIHYFPRVNVTCYSGIFVTYAIFTTLLIVSSYYLFNGISLETKQKQPKKAWQQLSNTLKQIDILFILLCVLVEGFIRNTWFDFTLFYLKELHGPTLLLGFSVSVIGFSGMITYYFSKWIILKLGGPEMSICLSYLIWSVRYICLAYMENPYFILVINLGHGMTYSLFKVAVLEYINVKCDPIILTTMCGIIETMIIIGKCIANMLGGSIYMIYGARIFFIGISILCISWCVVVTFVYILFKLKTRGTNKQFKYKPLRNSIAALNDEL